MNKEKPYIINRHVDKYARRNWFTDYWIPGVTLRTTVDIKPLADALKSKGLSLNSALIRAMAQALSEFPKLNYYTFWDKLVWAGEHTKISVIIEENKYEECNWDMIIDAEKKNLKNIQQNLLASVEKAKAMPQDKSFVNKMMNWFPRISYYIKRYSGQLIREYSASAGPIIVTNINIEGVEEMQLCGVYFSTIVSPGRAINGNLPLVLTFNHQLANARPVAAFLARVKDILENPKFSEEA